MASHTLSSHAPLSAEREPAYPDGWAREARACGQSPPGAAAAAAAAAPDPELSYCPGFAPGTERASEMGALVPRAALRTAKKKTWPNHSTHWILPTRLLPKRPVVARARARA